MMRTASERMSVAPASTMTPNSGFGCSRTTPIMWRVNAVMRWGHRSRMDIRTPLGRRCMLKRVSSSDELEANMPSIKERYFTPSLQNPGFPI